MKLVYTMLTHPQISFKTHTRHARRRQRVTPTTGHVRRNLSHHTQKREHASPKWRPLNTSDANISTFNHLELIVATGNNNKSEDCDCFTPFWADTQHLLSPKQYWPFFISCC